MNARLPDLTSPVTTPISSYIQRRAALAAQMQNGLAIVATAPELIRNRDAHYPYRHDSYFYYLTGFTEPEAVVVIVAEAGGAKSILFCREKNLEREIWDGYRYGPAAAREHFGFDEAYAIEALDEHLPKIIANQTSLHTTLGLDPAWDKRITDAITTVRNQTRAGLRAPSSLVDVREALDVMRLIKDQHEIALMRRAADISALAHKRAMARTQPGWMEYQVEAEILHEFLRFGAMSPAYGSIVASGPGACVLHYRENNRQIQAGELLLIDAGAEYGGYAADITRTFPVGAKFSGPQKDVYELVLAAQLACMDDIAPGKPFNAYHDTAERVLAQGMIDLGLLSGSLDSVLETASFKQYYMHRAGHWLGMDVHDAGEYKQRSGDYTTLAPGMVVTNEPGLYIRPADNVPEAFWNIGVRIEDDVLVTATGNENLTVAAPKTVVDVEAAILG